jgi:hypothetical protein
VSRTSYIWHAFVVYSMYMSRTVFLVSYCMHICRTPHNLPVCFICHVIARTPCVCLVLCIYRALYVFVSCCMYISRTECIYFVLHVFCSYFMYISRTSIIYIVLHVYVSYSMSLVCMPCICHVLHLYVCTYVHKIVTHNTS